jgi:hypothetical protein
MHSVEYYQSVHIRYYRMPQHTTGLYLVHHRIEQLWDYLLMDVEFAKFDQLYLERQTSRSNAETQVIAKTIENLENINTRKKISSAVPACRILGEVIA